MLFSLIRLVMVFTLSSSAVHASCSNYQLSLKHITFNLSDRAENIDDNAEFSTVLSTYQSKEIGRGFTANIDGTTNPFSSLQDDYLTQMSGYIDITEAGVHSFAVDGDDAVEVLIDGVVVASWYGGHSACSCTTHSGTVNLSVGKHTLEFRHHERTGSSVYKLYWKKPSETAFSVVPSGSLFHCSPIAPSAEYKFDTCVFDGTTGDVKDSGTNAYHGTSFNAQTISTEKTLTRSVDFSANSNSDYIQLNPVLLNGKSDFSIALWVKGSGPQDQALISMAHASENNEALLFITNGGTTFSPYIKGTTSSLTIPDITDNTWHHLVWKRNGTTGQNCLVIDGNTAAPYCVANAKTGALNVQGFIVAQDQDSVNGGFDAAQDFEGFMDELKIYTALLSDAEIATIYSNERSGRTHEGDEESTIFCSTNSCSNYGAKLNHKTYNLSTYVGGQIDSNAEFNSVITSYATDAFSFGSGLLAQINTTGANNNPFGVDERYLSVMNGYLYVPIAGNYTFMVNGDDAVEALIDDVVVSSWYGGHGASATPQSNTAITKVTLNLEQGYHKLVFHHHENTGSDSYQLYWQKPGDTNFEIIPASNLFHCLPYTPKAEYRFDECADYNGTANEIQDSGGNGFHATSSNLNQSENGKIYKAGDLSQNSITDYVSLPADTMHGLSDFTISLWMKSSSNSDQAIISGANSSQHNEMLLFITSGGTRIAPYVKGGSSSIVTSDVSNGAWHHIVWRRNGATGKSCLSVDANTTTCVNGNSGTLNIQALIVGQEQDNVGGGFDVNQEFEGLLDELKIYDKYLSDDEIKNIYTNENKSLNYDGSSRSQPFCIPLSQCYTDSFDGTSLGNKWTVINKLNYTPQVVGNKLMLTNLSGSVATGVTLIGEFPSADNYIQIEFEHNAYGGSGADGMTIALADASVVNPLIEANATNIAGASGGSLGYAQRTGVDGFKGGWLGFGLDEYGNFSSPSEGRVGGPGLIVDSISVRGKGSGQAGYEYITGTATLNPQVDNTPTNGYLYKLSIDTRSAKTLIKVERDVKDGNGYSILIDWYDATQIATSPEKFKFSMTGSSGGATNYHSLDDLAIKAANCGTLGKEEETKAYFFDAWNSDTSRANIYVGTKIVEQPFDILIGTIDSVFAPQDFNGTLCAQIVDENSVSLSSWLKIPFRNESTKTANFTISKARKKAKAKLVWKNNQDVNCPMSAETNSTFSSNLFAIRPKAFEISNPTLAYAGDNFTLDFKALSFSNSSSMDYNETKDGSFKIASSIEKAGCANGLLDISNFSFSNGEKLLVDANYSDVGDVNITIAERVGFEFALVDTADTTEANRLIAPAQLSVIVKPYELNITDANFTASTGKSWLYDANVSDMYVTAQATVQANNKQHVALQNFTSSCYAQPVALTFYYDVNNTNSNVSVSYDVAALNAQKSLSDINKTITLPITSFLTAKALAEYKFNVDRSHYQALNPIDMALREVKVTSTDVAKNENNVSVNSPKRFYYGRVKTKDIHTDKTSALHALHVEVYSTSALSGFYQNTLHWYINSLDTNVTTLGASKLVPYSGFTISTPLSTPTLLGVSGMEGGKMSFTLFNPTQQKGATFHLDVPLWLWYSTLNANSYNALGDCSVHPCFEYRFLENANTIGIKSGEFKGSTIGSDFNSSYQKSGVKTFR